MKCQNDFGQSFPPWGVPSNKKDSRALHSSLRILAAESLILFTKTIYEIKEGGGGCSPTGTLPDHYFARYGHEF